MPTIAIRTMSFENVRVDLNVIRLAIKDAKLNAGMFFVPSQICAFAVKNAV
jgi:hypothetical protein